jgi:Flp pilus assembly protein TadG
MKRLRSDSGATAVEFALVMLPLLLLLMGIIDFGNAYSTKLSMTAAAREGVRVMAISNDPVAARTATKNAAGLSPALKDAQIAFSPTTCPVSTTGTTSVASNISVTVSYPMESLTGFFSKMMAGDTLRATATMRCNG